MEKHGAALAQADDVLEMDEMVSFVSEKWFKRWLWTTIHRRTRQIVAYAIGDRSETTAKKLWKPCRRATASAWSSRMTSTSIP
jgi:IS1 family transposase